MKRLLDELRGQCARLGLRCPSRSTVYRYMRQGPGPSYEIATLPDAARAALYNLADTGSVPAAQLVFYCFNYGDLQAVHFAAGLPWLPLHQAHAMRGWRPKSLGLLRAVLLDRGIPRG